MMPSPTRSEELSGWPGHEECLEAVGRAVVLARDASSPKTPETIETLGEGWVAEEALAISLYAALSFPDDFPAAVRLAVNHGGDSDSTGSITGSILGALLGMSAIPSPWISAAGDARRAHRDSRGHAGVAGEGPGQPGEIPGLVIHFKINRPSCPE